MQKINSGKEQNSCSENDVIYVCLNNWLGYKTTELNQFVDELSELEANVNYNWEVLDCAMVFYITTTKEYLISRGILEVFTTKGLITKGGNEYPEFNLSIVDDEVLNRKYIGDDE